MKKYLIIVIIIAIVYLLFQLIQSPLNASLTTKASTTTPGAMAAINSQKKSFANINWLTNHPQLHNITPLGMTAAINQLRTSESISNLIGPIDNPYGVRNDILAAILASIPESQPEMLRATIYTAYYQNLAYYSASDDDKLKQLRKSSLAQHCMVLAEYKLTHELTNYSKVVRSISDLMRNNKARLAWSEQVEETAFAWQTIGSGLDSYTEDELCAKGEY